MAATDRHATAALTARRCCRARVAGDAAGLRALFDARAPIVGHFRGAVAWQDLETFIAEAQGPVGRHGAEDCRIEGLRIDGSIAQVTVAGRYAGLWIIDHLLMVETGGAWVPAAKTFHVAPQPRGARGPRPRPRPAPISRGSARAGQTAAPAAG